MLSRNFLCAWLGLREGSGPRHWTRRSGEVAADGALDWRAASARWTSSRDGSQEVQNNTSIAQSSFLAAPTSADRAYLCDALLKHKCSSHFMLVQIQRSKPKQRIRDKGVWHYSFLRDNVLLLPLPARLRTMTPAGHQALICTRRNRPGGRLPIELSLSLCAFGIKRSGLEGSGH